MKIKDLPNLIKRRAKAYAKKNYPNKKHRPKGIMKAFNWDITEEGFQYWAEVYNGDFIKAEKLLSERLKEEYPLAYKITQLIEDNCWTGTSTDSCKESPFFFDEVLDIKVNAPEVVDPIVEKVREKLKQRSAVGIKKYGTTLDRNDLSLEQWLDHATEEAMDFCLYLTKIKEDLKNK
jgi:hypothetical protein